MASLTAIRAVNDSRQAAEKALEDRKRCLLVLILAHLAEHGYAGSYERLCSEAGLSLGKVQQADNVCLLHILQSFEEAHEQRFGRRPRLTRPGSSAESALPSSKPAGKPVSGAANARDRRTKGVAAEASAKAEALVRRRATWDSFQPPEEIGGQRVAGVIAGSATGGAASECEAALGVDGLRMQPGARAASDGAPPQPSAQQSLEDRLLKPLPDLGSSELRDLGAAISRDIYQHSPGVQWQDVKGLSTAKALLKEAVVMPARWPQLFTGILTPWRGVLLYGPPGTGKTMLAKAVATECQTTFFNISASSIISKWRGDSEKLVRVLFELARYHAPSTIFLDELDALMAVRGGEGEHEASRRMKTELLIQMDGLAHAGSGDGAADAQGPVFVLAATNLPWLLDLAMLRRLEKRIHVPLPELEARDNMLRSLLSSRGPDAGQLAALAARTEGYSGSDITSLCKEAAMRPLRRLMTAYDAAQDEGDSASQQPGLDMGPITPEDLQGALDVTKASATRHAHKFEQFSKDYGQAGS